MNTMGDLANVSPMRSIETINKLRSNERNERNHQKTRKILKNLAIFGVLTSIGFSSFVFFASKSAEKIDDINIKTNSAVEWSKEVSEKLFSDLNEIKDAQKKLSIELVEQKTKMVEIKQLVENIRLEGANSQSSLMMMAKAMTINENQVAKYFQEIANNMDDFKQTLESNSFIMSPVSDRKLGAIRDDKRHW